MATEHIKWCIENALKKSTDKERLSFFKSHMMRNPETKSLVIKKDLIEKVKILMLRGNDLENWIKSFS